MNFLLESDTWREIYDSLRKNKLRTAITMIGVWWGILLLVVLLGSARGLENKFNAQFGDFATNSVFVWGGATGKAYKGYQEGRIIRMKSKDIPKLKENVNGVQIIIPRMRRNNVVTHESLSGSFAIQGDYPDLDKIQKVPLVAGRFINQSDMNIGRKVVIISEEVQEQLYKEEEKKVIGSYVKIGKSMYKVIGIAKSEERMGPSISIIMPYTTFQKQFNTGEEFDFMIVNIHPDFDIETVETNLINTLKNLYKVHPKDSLAFSSFNMGKEFRKLIGFLKGMQFITWFVGIATLIAGVFAIGNILLITVKERTQEIGIRRAIGAQPMDIQRQIIFEAIVITLVSGLLGITSGGWLLIGVDKIFGQGPDPSLINPSVSIPVVLVAIVLLIISGALIGLIPARKAIKVKPIEALRDE